MVCYRCVISCYRFAITSVIRIVTGRLPGFAAAFAPAPLHALAAGIAALAPQLVLVGHRLVVGPVVEPVPVDAVEGLRLVCGRIKLYGVGTCFGR